MIDYTCLPEGLHAGMQRYIDHGLISETSFLRRVVENDFTGAVLKADEVNLASLRDICLFVRNEAPAQCHGSPERVSAWIARGGSQAVAA